MFVKAAEYIEEAQKHCLVVEDAEAGLKAAIAGGMDCAASEMQSDVDLERIIWLHFQIY